MKFKRLDHVHLKSIPHIEEGISVLRPWTGPLYSYTIVKITGFWIWKRYTLHGYDPAGRAIYQNNVREKELMHG